MTAVTLRLHVCIGGRSLLLRNVRVEPRCPLVTKSYGDITLFQMPQNLPFTVDSGSATDSIFIAGKVAWAMK